MPWHFGIPMVGGLTRVTDVYSETAVRTAPTIRVTDIYTESVVRAVATIRVTDIYTETVVHP